MKVRVPEHVYLSELDGRIVLLDTRKNQYYALNETGCELLKALKEGTPTADAIDHIAAFYNEDRNKVKKDMESFIHYLISEGLLERQ